MTVTARIARVLAGVDFDEASAAALKMAARLVASWDARLTVFHAATEAVPAYFTASQFDELEAERERSRAVTADQLRAFALPHVPAAFDVVVGHGPAEDALVRLAPAFDLILLGTHRRRGPQRWWLGSVAESVVRRSPRPVLVVPQGASVPATEPPTIIAAGTDGTTADTWVDALQTALRADVARSLGIAHCTPDRLGDADLIVLARPSGEHHSQWRAMAHVLRECAHPVLFVPTSGEILERSST